MPVGPIRAFSFSVASGDTMSDAQDLGGAYQKVLLGIPTMSSGTDIRLWVAASEDGTYRKLYHRPEAVSGVVVAMNIDSSITQAFVPVELHSQFFKVEIGSYMTDTVTTFDVICSGN